MYTHRACHGGGNPKYRYIPYPIWTGFSSAQQQCLRIYVQDAEKGRNSANGMSAYLSRTTFAGTPCWMAPEVMEDGIECAPAVPPHPPYRAWDTACSTFFQDSTTCCMMQGRGTAECPTKSSDRCPVLRLVSWQR